MEHRRTVDSGVGAARPRNVCVVGAGYVGLTAAACLAELGHTVRCVESDPVRLASLLGGHVPIHEPGLDELVSAHAATGRLSFTDDIYEATRDTGVALLCVGTPPRPDGEPDLRQLGRAAIEVATQASEDMVLVVKSTVPPGTCEALELLASGHARPGVRVNVASNPEFLRESEAVWDFFNPDRVVVGVDVLELEETVVSLYPSQWPMLVCDRRSAELVKYAANTFLALKISFANEVAALCEALGAESHNVLAGIGLDTRIGGAFLSPGPGFGGSCLPKDLSGFIAVAASVGQRTPIAEAAQLVNDGAIASLIKKLEVALGPLDGKRISVLGIAFKPGTSDVRFSPGLALIDELVARGATVRAHDPLARHSSPTFEQVDDPYRAAAGADALVVVTAWAQYRTLSPQLVRKAMAGHAVIDAVHALDLRDYHDAGFDIYGVGRGLATSFAPVLSSPLEWMLESESVEDLVAP